VEFRFQWLVEIDHWDNFLWRELTLTKGLNRNFYRRNRLFDVPLSGGLKKINHRKGIRNQLKQNVSAQRNYQDSRLILPITPKINRLIRPYIPDEVFLNKRRKTTENHSTEDFETKIAQRKFQFWFNESKKRLVFVHQRLYEGVVFLDRFKYGWEGQWRNGEEFLIGFCLVKFLGKSSVGLKGWDYEVRLSFNAIAVES